MNREKIHKLTSLSSCAGCAAKLGQADLTQILRDLPQHHDENVLIGSATSDDAAVYQLTPDTALVQTLDFFTPIVDDPFLYGQIAATNALSDVYAMGGRPITAMNIMGVPTDVLSLETINKILQGGAAKVAEAKCAMVGGHTVKSPEPLYGLSVTGLLHPQQIMSNGGAKPGELLVLTKPIGTGIITTAIKRGLANDDITNACVTVMSTLNTPGTRIAEEGLCRAATDVTGFGLLGHLGNICKTSRVRAVLHSPMIPVIDPQIIRWIEQGCIPGGTKGNLSVASTFTTFSTSVADSMKYLLADAQTSGGLLLCVPPAHLENLLNILREENTLSAAIIGELYPADDDSQRITVE